MFTKNRNKGCASSTDKYGETTNNMWLKIIVSC